MSENEDHGPGVRVHPPIIVGTGILAGLGLNRLHRWPMPHELNDDLYGVLIISVAFIFAMWALIKFLRAGTDVRPDTPDSALITSGPYRFTRNPLYISLALIQVTAAIWFNSLWILLLTPLSVIIIRYYAISREEHYLEQRFGQQYLDYKRSVRRWL